MELKLIKQQMLLFNGEKRFELTFDVVESEILRQGQSQIKLYVSERQSDTSKYLGQRISDKHGKGEHRWIKFEMVYNYKFLLNISGHKEKVIEHHTGMIQGLVDAETMSWIEIKRKDWKTDSEHYKTYLKNRSLFVEFMSSIEIDPLTWENLDFSLEDLENADAKEFEKVEVDTSKMVFETIEDMEHTFFTSLYYKNLHDQEEGTHHKAGSEVEKKTTFTI